MELKLIKENADGSADYSVDLTEEERDAFVLFAVRRALEEAIKTGKEWQSPGDAYQMELFTDEQQ